MAKAATWGEEKTFYHYDFPIGTPCLIKFSPLKTFRMELQGISMLMLISLAGAICYSTLYFTNHSRIDPSPSAGSVENVEPKQNLATPNGSQSLALSYVHTPLPESIDVEGMLSLQDRSKLLIVDARSRFYFRKRHIPNAINVPWNDIDGAYRRAGLEAVEFDSAVVVYCESSNCKDSKVVASAFRSLGYKNVTVFTGGLQEWERAELPLTKSQ